MTDTGHVTLDDLLDQAAEAAEGRNGAPAAMTVKMQRLITLAWESARVGTVTSLTGDDRALIARAHDIGPGLRASGSDRDRLAGWLLAELAGLAERLGGA